MSMNNDIIDKAVDYQVDGGKYSRSDKCKQTGINNGRVAIKPEKGITTSSTNANTSTEFVSCGTYGNITPLNLTPRRCQSQAQPKSIQSATPNSHSQQLERENLHYRIL